MSDIKRKWTPEQEAQMVALWNEGKSGENCAAILSQEWGFPVTRSGVIGRVSRMKLPKRVKPAREPKPNAQNSQDVKRPYWSDAEKALLRELWPMMLTARKMAAMIHPRFTMQSVTSQAESLGLPRRTRAEISAILSAVNAVRPRNPTGSIKKPKPVQYAKPKPSLPEPIPSGLITIATLELHHCKWPIGDPKNTAFHFCGAQRDDGSSYCEYHRAIAKAESKPRKISTYFEYGRKAA